MARRAVTPAIGGLLAGAVLLVARRVAHGRRQHDYIEAIAKGNGRQEVAGTLLRCGSPSLLTIASGGSIGREGAMVQLSAATGSWIGQVARFSGGDLRLLLACGAAAGFASAYDAALSGAVFIAEIVYGTLAIRRLGPLMVASVTANVTVHQVLGYKPVYDIPPLQVASLWELPIFLLLGLLLGAFAPVFMCILDGTGKLAARARLPLPLQLGAGGLVVGLISVWRPQVWGNGYSVVNDVLHAPWPAAFVVSVLAAKIIATAATTGSGAVGGVFTPTLFVGALIGLLAGVSSRTRRGPHSSPADGLRRDRHGRLPCRDHPCPIDVIPDRFWMTLEYQLVPALMLACALHSYHVSRAIRPRVPIYNRALLRGNATEAEAPRTPNDTHQSSPGRP